MSSFHSDKIKGEIAETKGDLNAEKANPVRNEALIVALQKTLTAQQNNENKLVVQAADNFAFFSSLSIILMCFVITYLPYVVYYIKEESAISLCQSL